MPKDGKSVRFSPDLLQQLQRMADLNICGGSPSEIIRRFVYEGIERVTKEGLIEKALHDRKLLVQEKRDTIKVLNAKSSTKPGAA